MLRGNRHALGPLLAAALWGGMYVVSKWGLGLVPPVTLAFLRVALAAVVLLAVVRATKPRRSFSRADWRRFALLGVAVTLTLISQFVGTDLTNASQGSLLTVLTPVFTLLLGVALLDEPLSRTKVGGMALALLGTVIVLAGRYDLGTTTAGNALGVGALFAASLAWAAYTVGGRDLVRTYSALETATYSTLFAVPMLLCCALVELAVAPVAVDPARLGVGFGLAVVYLGVFSTAVAWYAWYKGLETVDSGTVAVFFFAQPVVGALLGASLLGESLGPLFVLGGAVMAVGVAVVSATTSA